LQRRKVQAVGPVIVDEEQHFGVAHKERLKALKADVHVLTLTATPIPRTLQMAMCGPARASASSRRRRRPARRATYVTPWDPVVVREALLASIIAAAELLRRAAHRRPARHRGMAPRRSARE
jgi:transcription-repair coupling factor (superfamily II helicase)